MIIIGILAAIAVLSVFMVGLKKFLAPAMIAVKQYFFSDKEEE